jgi:hypothetical protein
LFTIPVSAQQAPNQSDVTGGNVNNNIVPPNQSDTTGTNIFNNTAPIFRNDGKLSPDVVSNARRLSQELEEAASRCCFTRAPAGPRRFARNPGTQTAACPDCETLNSVVQETKVFIEDVNRQAEQIRSASRNSIW